MAVVYLWCGQHVQAPGAHLAVSGDADEIVSVLRPQHIHTVHRVLQTHTQKTENSVDADEEDEAVCVCTV